MRAIVTVTGKDKVGIIARVSGLLSDMGVNVEDISQTILADFFAMFMLVEVGEAKVSELAEKLNELGKKVGVAINIQHEDVFNAMHRI